MLVSLPSLVVLLLSAAAGKLSGSMGDAPLHSGNTPITPRDASTLVLALIGAATMAIYLVARWRPSRPDVSRCSGHLSEQAERADAVEAVEERRSRGAA